MMTPIVGERPAKMLLVSALGVYASAAAAAHTLAAVVWVTAPPLSTRETVAVDTPACAATSPIVALFTHAPPVPDHDVTTDHDGSDAVELRGVRQHQVGDRARHHAATPGCHRRDGVRDVGGRHRDSRRQAHHAGLGGS